MPKFTNASQIETFFKRASSKAVKKTCEQLLEVLKQFIMSEYYNMYSPTMYDRTMQFYNSAMCEMLSDMAGKVYMEPDAMNYKDWSGSLQISMANQGSHGGYIQTRGAYWDRFNNYCNANAINMLKANLRVYGIPVK